LPKIKVPWSKEHSAEKQTRREWEEEHMGIVGRVGTGVKPKRRNEWYCWKIRLLKALVLVHMLIPSLHKEHS